MSILGIRHRQLNKCRSIDIDHRVPVQKWSIYQPPRSKNGLKMVYRPSRSMSTVDVDDLATTGYEEIYGSIFFIRLLKILT